MRNKEGAMSRGKTPRQPSRSGRHDGARRAQPAKASPASKSASRAKVRPAPAKTATKANKPASRKATPGYNPLAPERVRGIISGLDEMHPNVTCALTHRSAWELLVATILSAQSTDVGVNKVTPELFRKYPTVEDFATLTPEQLEPDVRSTGFFRNKSKSVVGAAQKIVGEFNGEVPA